jgi:hypothetical protein
MSLRSTVFIRSASSWTAVARGAVIIGCEKNLRSVDLTLSSDKNYGIIANTGDYTAFSTTDPLPPSRRDTNELLWLYKKGDLIFRGEPSRVEVDLAINVETLVSKRGEVIIYSHLGDEGDVPQSFLKGRWGLSSKLSVTIITDMF